MRPPEARTVPVTGSCGVVLVVGCTLAPGQPARISSTWRRQILAGPVMCDLQIGEVTVRAGELLLLATRAANHDPAVFADPDLFDVTRQGPAHLALGTAPTTASAPHSPGPNWRLSSP